MSIRSKVVEELEASYWELVRVFGAPSLGDPFKTDALWIVRDPERGSEVMIYHWKNGRAYCGDGAPAVEDITDWHINGDDQRAVELVRHRLGRFGGV